jgi:hypothetical protein
MRIAVSRSRNVTFGGYIPEGPKVEIASFIACKETD